MIKNLKLTLFISAILFLTQNVLAEDGKCVGKFINPITDICWSCVFPISIGGSKIKSGSNRHDTQNPSNIVCGCTKDNIPRVGLSVGFWEPVRMIDVTRKPLCLVSLGGISLGYDRNQGGTSKYYTGDDYNQHSFYHLHVYLSPTISWLKLLTDLGCVTKGDSLDILYMSEYDPTYKNDANFLNPEVYLFANPAAQLACSADCISATTHLPQDGLFWCAGCLGSIYPFSGTVTGHIGGVQASSLLSVRILAKLHRMGLSYKTATSDGKINGPLCSNQFAPKIIKSQYRLQMTYPIANTKGQYSCNALGMSDVLYSSGREFPYKGEDFAYVVWRKKNCCFRAT